MAEFKKIVSISLKLILIISIFSAINNELYHILSANLFLLALLFLPNFLKSTKIQLPVIFEVILFIFVLLVGIFGNSNSYIAPIAFGISVGFIGLLISLILYSSNQIKRNPFLITLFSFNLAMSFAAILELLKFYLKNISGESTQNLYNFTMMNLTYVLTGALLASLFGLLYMKTRLNLISILVKKFKKRNPELFKNSSNINEIIKLIEKGEGSKLEFKSTLRTNLYNNQKDKNIQFPTLKTICAFLNSKGGTLLIGVEDSGKIIGIEKDDFQNKDKFNLHLLNIIKQKIGKKYLNKINIEIIKNEKENNHIAKIDCKPSNEPVFIKQDKLEKFYIRTGPATSEIFAKDLIDYVNKRFKKN